MPVSNKTLEALKKLKQLAASGDAKAKATLERVLATVRTSLQNKQRDEQMAGMVESGALDHLLLQGHDTGDSRHDSEGNYILRSERGDAVVGEDEIAGDELDSADRVISSMPYADGLDQKVAIRDQKYNALVKQAPFARVQPRSVLHGNTGLRATVSTRGIVTTVPLSSILVQSVAAFPIPPIVKVDGNAPALAQVAQWGGDDVETMPVTVTLAPIQQLSATPNELFTAPARPYGAIQFGTRDVLVNAEVDIGTGVQFTVNASQITVRVGLNQDISNVLTMNLSGMLSFLPPVRTTRVTRTVYLDETPPGGGEKIFVPAFARDVSLWRDGIAPAFADAIRFEFLDSVGNVVYVVVLAAGVLLLEPVPLSGDVVAINVVGSTFMHIRLIFGLSF